MISSRIILLLLSLNASLYSQTDPRTNTKEIPEIKPKTQLYKIVEMDSLMLDIYYPKEFVAGNKKSAIVFFFGGGWVRGDRNHFRLQAQYLASKGIIAITADYRTQSRHGTSPVAAMKDAKSAMRWIKDNAEELGIDTLKLAAAGGSAGGHLAASTAIIPEFNEGNDNLELSPKPQLLVLFNPVINTSRKGYGAEKMGKHKKAASPFHRTSKGVPPTLILHGQEDQVVPLKNITQFQRKMESFDNVIKVKLYPGQGHGFFNIRDGQDRYFWETLTAAEDFLRSYGYIP